MIRYLLTLVLVFSTTLPSFAHSTSKTTAYEFIVYEDTLDLTKFYLGSTLKTIPSERCGLPKEFSKVYQIREEYRLPFQISSKVETYQYDQVGYDGELIPTLAETLEFSAKDASGKWFLIDPETKTERLFLEKPLHFIAKNFVELRDRSAPHLDELIQTRKKRLSLDIKGYHDNDFFLKIGPFKIDIDSRYSFPFKAFKYDLQLIPSNGDYFLQSLGLTDLETYTLNEEYGQERSEFVSRGCDGIFVSIRNKRGELKRNAKLIKHEIIE